MKVKFSRCNSNNLAQVPQVDGQMTYVKDAQELYMDIGNTRTQLTNIITVADINNVVNPLTNKVYYDEATSSLYKSLLENNVKKWTNLGGMDNIFEWDGKTGTQNPDNLVLWQKIYDKQKEKGCIVLDSGNGDVIAIPKNQLTQYDVAYGLARQLYTTSDLGVTKTFLQAKKYQIMKSNEQITFISEMGTSSMGAIASYLGAYTTSTLYVPTKDSDPANKKYVDDNKTNITIREWS